MGVFHSSPRKLTLEYQKRLRIARVEGLGAGQGGHLTPVIRSIIITQRLALSGKSGCGYLVFSEISGGNLRCIL